MIPELELATATARKAGKIILNYFKRDYHIRDKGHHNPVTTADLEANTLIRSQITTNHPEDGWLSEESVDSRERLTKRRVWIVDPLDGTFEFIRGVPEFVVSIALTIDREPVIGIIYNPVTNELYTASDGAAYLNGKRLQCSNQSDLKKATVSVSRSETRAGLWQPYTHLFKKSIVSGSIATKLVNTAARRSDLTISLRSKHEWDICAADLIVRNAGGVVINRNLQPIRYNSANPVIPNGLIAGPAPLVALAKPLFRV
ncbi:MAG: 3'(2'),5'-bisphosphate nucleotidase CysQ [Fidelibacterota bacterium]